MTRIQGSQESREVRRGGQRDAAQQEQVRDVGRGQEEGGGIGHHGDGDGQAVSRKVAAQGGPQGDWHGDHDGDVQVDERAQEGGERQDGGGGGDLGVPRAGMSALARIRNAPSRSASAEARMIAARVANGLAVAVAAAAEASGRSAAAMIAKDDARGPYGDAERVAG